MSRGFSALAVVLWHWRHFAYHGGVLSKGFDMARQPFYSVLRVFYAKGGMGVQYFFLLSGFVFFWLYRSSIEDRRMSFRDFWLKRISRLYPLHVLTLLIVALLQILYVLLNGNPFVYRYNDAYHLILNLLFASGWGLEKGFSFNAPVWSVSVEVLLYFIFFVVAYVRKGRGLFCLLISILSLGMLNFARLTAIGQGISLFFFGGVVFYVALLVSTRFCRLKPLIYFIAIISWILTIVDSYVFDISELILRLGFLGSVLLFGFPGYVLFPTTLCSLALVETDKGARYFGPISWIGDITYSSYLLHFPLQLVFALGVSIGVLDPSFYLSPISLVIFLLLLIPLSYITFVAFERPMLVLIRSKCMGKDVVSDTQAP